MENIYTMKTVSAEVFGDHALRLTLPVENPSTTNDSIQVRMVLTKETNESRVRISLMVKSGNEAWYKAEIDPRKYQLCFSDAMLGEYQEKYDIDIEMIDLNTAQVIGEHTIQSSIEFGCILNQAAGYVLDAADSSIEMELPIIYGLNTDGIPAEELAMQASVEFVA